MLSFQDELEPLNSGLTFSVLFWEQKNGVRWMLFEHGFLVYTGLRNTKGQGREDARQFAHELKLRQRRHVVTVDVSEDEEYLAA